VTPHSCSDLPRMNVAKCDDAVPKSNSSQILSKVEGVLCARPALHLPSRRSILLGRLGKCPSVSLRSQQRQTSRRILPLRITPMTVHALACLTTSLDLWSRIDRPCASRLNTFGGQLYSEAL
jgi:hypothetical protein